jgi:hypothetical protein
MGTLSANTGASVNFTAGNTGGAVGLFVNATLNDLTKSSQAVVIAITAVPKTVLSAVTITPIQVTLVAGTSQLFTASAICTNGGSNATCPTTGIKYAWSLNSTDANITPIAGPTTTFTAGNSAGVVALIASATLNGVLVQYVASININATATVPQQSNYLGLSGNWSYIVLGILIPAVVILAIFLVGRRRAMAKQTAANEAQEQQGFALFGATGAVGMDQADQGQYVAGQPDQGQYAGDQVDQGQYAPGQPDQGQYAAEQPDEGHFIGGQTNPEQYAAEQPDQGQFIADQTNPAQYAAEHPDQGQYIADQTNPAQYAAEHPDQGQYAPEQPAQEQVAPSQNPAEYNTGVAPAAEPESQHAEEVPPAHVYSDVGMHGEVVPPVVVEPMNVPWPGVPECPLCGGPLDSDNVCQSCGARQPPSPQEKPKQAPVPSAAPAPAARPSPIPAAPANLPHEVKAPAARNAPEPPRTPPPTAPKEKAAAGREPRAKPGASGRLIPDKCFICGSPLEGDYCPVCEMHWHAKT